VSAAYDDWAPYYDVTDADRSPFIEFYSRLVLPTTRSLLELGCGTGTIGAALGDLLGEGRRVVGVDESEGMLRIAAGRRPGDVWIRGDMRKPPVEGPFDLVLSCFNTLQLLHEDHDLLAALRSARRLLSPSGRFAFDLYQPNLPYLRVEQVDRLARVAHDEQGRRLEIREDTRYDEGTRVLWIDWRLVAPEQGADHVLARTSYGLRQYQVSDVARLLGEAGLAIQQTYGDFDRTPLTGASKKQIYVCANPGL
jgi:SAM-dependent methyltransferase